MRDGRLSVPRKFQNRTAACTPSRGDPTFIRVARSGLGYYFTRHIVQAHGGRLTASTAPGGGLQVEILLPAGA